MLSIPCISLIQQEIKFYSSNANNDMRLSRYGSIEMGDNGYIIIGAPTDNINQYTNAGTSYLFEINYDYISGDMTVSQLQQFIVNDGGDVPNDDELFGHSVSITSNGDGTSHFLIIGAPGERVNDVYIYGKTILGLFEFTTKLSPWDSNNAYNEFGYSVLIVPDIYENHQAGSTYYLVFVGSPGRLASQGMLYV